MTPVGQLIASTKHFCQTSGLREGERFCLLFYSRFSVEFSSVESSCVAINWFCVCTVDHTSIINAIIIEIYTVVVFML